MLSMLSIKRGSRLDSVESVEAGEKLDSNDRQQILRLSISRRKERGDVAQLVRALPCHGRGRGFEPRRPRHTFQKTYGTYGPIVTMKSGHNKGTLSFLTCILSLLS